ncbi:MAG: NAD(P)/FAD-dependent oxidoreductase [Planctomycetota bacterium]
MKRIAKMIDSVRAKSTKPKTYDVAVVGAGAAGVGIAIALRDAGVENFVVLDRHGVGASFAAWPRETRFITPSFPTNSIGMLDLNSIAIGVSPAFNIEAEHPTGAQYAAHLQGVAEFFQVPVRADTDVQRVTKEGDRFLIETADDTIVAKHVVWAAGEFQYPRTDSFPGSHLCWHTATLGSYRQLDGDAYFVIGGFESGIDAAYHLALQGKRVRLFDRGSPWKDEGSDPSVVLSVFSRQRLRSPTFQQQVELMPDTPIESVSVANGGYDVTAADGQTYHTDVPPLLAGGFRGSHHLVADLFESRDDGFPLLSDHDESTRTPGLFLCGPAVRHGNQVFCFIYKYRQRFAVVAKAIATSLGLPAEQLEHYRNWGMYLDDLSCCGEECVC